MLSKTASVRAAIKQSCHTALARGLHYSGLLSAIRRFEGSHEFPSSPAARRFQPRRSSGSKFAILCYHRVGTEGVPFHSNLNPRLFLNQIRYLKENYRVVSLEQLTRELLDSAKVPPTLAITFDDGYRDLYTHALPVLQKYEIPATIYLIGRSMESGEAPWYDRVFASLAATRVTSLEVDTNGLRQFYLSTPSLRRAAAWEIVCYLRSIPDTERQMWCAEFERRFPPPSELLEGRMLNWDQVRAMRGAGISFGAHTMTHPSVSQLDSSALQYEIVHCKKLLETELDSPVQDFAYPFGKWSDGSSAAQNLLVQASYRSAVTTIEGFNSSGDSPLMLRRFQISDDASLPLFAFNLSRLFFSASSGSEIPQYFRMSLSSAIERQSGRSVS